MDIGQRKDLEKLTAGYLSHLKLEMAKDKRMMTPVEYGGSPNPPQKTSSANQASKAPLTNSTSASKLRPITKSGATMFLTDDFSTRQINMHDILTQQLSKLSSLALPTQTISTLVVHSCAVDVCEFQHILTTHSERCVILHRIAL